MDMSASAPAPTAPPPPPSSSRRRHPPIFWVLVGLLVLLLAIGIGSFAYYFTLTHQAPAVIPRDNAWDSLDPQGISTGIAVWTLTEIEPEQIYRQAMAITSLETAAAAAVTTPTLSDEQRVGWLSVLARRYLLAGDTVRAEAYYRWDEDLVYLAPDLSDGQRLNMLLEIAQGWAALENVQQARHTLEQVVYGVQNDHELPLTVRRQILRSVADIYLQLGDVKQGRTIAALPMAASATLTQTQTVVPQPLQWLTSAPPPDEDVERFHAARIGAAQRFVDAWIANQGEVSRSQYQSLADALLDEDITRHVYYQRFLGTDTLSEDLLRAVLWDQVQWLVLKHRVASQLYGRSLVSKWEGELPAIRQETHQAFADFIDALLQYSETLPADEQAAAKTSIYRQALLWARLGLYPDADTIFLANALNDNRRQLAHSTILTPVIDIAEDNSLHISWSGAE